MTIKNYLKFTLLSVLVCFGLLPLGGYGGHGVKFLVAAMVYFLLTHYGLYKATTSKERVLVLLILVLPPVLLYTPAYIADYKGTRVSYPSTLAYFIGIVVGAIAHFTTMRVKVALFTMLLAGSTWVAFIGFHYWMHNINFGTFTGNVEYPMPAPILGTTQHGEAVTEESSKNKVVLLDFWHTRCGSCFEKFPQLEDLYNTYKTDTSVVVLAVNSPLKQDTTGQAFAMLEKRGYSFPVLLPTIDTLSRLYDVQVVPTTFVIDKEGKVVFRGRLENASAVLATMREKDI